MVALLGLGLAACDRGDDIDTELELRGAAVSMQCSESFDVIGLRVEQGVVEWSDEQYAITNQDVVIAVGNAYDVTLCVDLASSSDSVQIGDDGQVFGFTTTELSDCVVIERAWIDKATGFAELELEITASWNESSEQGSAELQNYLAPIKSSGKIKIVTSCPKYDLTY